MDWSAKQERQYEHVKASCMARSRCSTKTKKTSCYKTCERIAASTVNRGIATSKLKGVGQLVTATTVAGTKSRKKLRKTSRKSKRRNLGCGCSSAKPAK